MYVKLLSKLSNLDSKTLVSIPILFCTVPLAIVALPLCMAFLAIYGSYRSLNLLLKKIFRPDLLERLDCLTQSYTSNWYGTSDPNTTQVFIIKGRLHPEAVLRELEERLEIPALQRLQQFPVDFGGYYYWKDEEGFNLSQHVKHLNPSVFLKEDLEKLLEESNHAKWPEGKSPWEVLLINNYFNAELQNSTEGHSVVVLRTHQCFHDIYQNILLRTKSSSTPLFTSVQEAVMSPYHAIKDLIKLRQKLNIPTRWYGKYEEDKVSVKNFRTVFSQVWKQEVQDIARKLHVSTDAVLQGIVLTLLQRTLKTYGFSCFRTVSLSKNSNFTGINDLPESSHGIQNIRRSNEEMKGNQGSTIQKSWSLHQTASGFLPTCLHGSNMYEPKVSLDQVQGPRSIVTFGGHEIVGILKLGNYPGDSSEGISIVSYTYKEEITISLSAFNLNFPGEVLDNLGELLQGEIREVNKNLRM